MNAPTQLFIAGTEPPDDIPAVRDAITRELDLADELRALRTRFKAAQDATTAKMVEVGVERHPYIDGRTGKRRFRLADTTPKAKTIAAAGSPGRRKKRSRPERDDAEIAEPAEDTRIEMRRVSRTAAHDAVVDPFGGTRASMTPKHANGVNPALLARGKGKRGK